jgi:hypothetical protein
MAMVLIHCPADVGSAGMCDHDLGVRSGGSWQNSMLEWVMICLFWSQRNRAGGNRYLGSLKILYISLITSESQPEECADLESLSTSVEEKTLPVCR